ncbi:MAG: M48 family peptidase [Nitrospirae bacterium]|nr:MAG: M48 family peptidase [Nitrospirota bacterium]
MRESLRGWNPNRRKTPAQSLTSRTPLSLDRLQGYWRELACRYFDNRLPPIRIEWSSRLTSSAGLFVSLVGARARRGESVQVNSMDRLIRLSLPLLGHQPEREIIRTLAHEMIHQWQYDIRRSRPSHGRDFRDKMEELNRDGLDVTIRHTLNREVEALARYVWRCLRCGMLYRRQRRTISPQRHRCGSCHGLLVEDALHPTNLTVDSPPNAPMWKRSAAYKAQPTTKASTLAQLRFDFMERPS